jgi:polysaccharide biosynthesis protein PslH
MSAQVATISNMEERNSPGRKRVLAIMGQFPWPLDRGGHIRSYHLLRSIAAVHDVTLLCRWHTEVDASLVRDLGIRLIGEPLNPRSRASELHRLTTCALQGIPFVCYGKHYSRGIESTLSRLVLEELFDVAYLDHIDTWLYRNQLRDLPVVVDFHNVYSQLVERVADEQSGWFRSSYLKRESKLVERVERGIAQSARHIFTVSAEDRNRIREFGAGAVSVASNGVDCVHFRYRPAEPSSEPVVLFLGSLDWPSNVVAAEFLARDVMPVLRKRFPQITLSLVGRNPTQSVHELSALPNVKLLPNIADVRDAFSQSTILAVPLDSGGGSRIKILEAFASGVPVVSTPIGCEGIDCEAEKHLLVTDRSNFANAITQVLTQPDRLWKFAENGRALVEAKYDWKHIGRTVADMVGRLSKVEHSGVKL